MDPDAKQMLQAASRYSSLGIFFGVAIVLGYLGGRWLDGRLHTAPWLSMVGLFVGIIAGFRELYRLAKRGMNDEAGSGGGDDTDSAGDNAGDKAKDDSKDHREP